jgi:hypothetical protein
MLRNFRALKMAVSLESVMHNNGQRDIRREKPAPELAGRAFAPDLTAKTSQFSSRRSAPKTL